MMRTRTYCAIAFVALSAPLSGCSGSTTETPLDPFTVQPAELVPAQSCEDLESKLKSDALHRMNSQLDMMREWARSYDTVGWGRGGEDEVSAGAGGASSGFGANGADGGAEPPEHSDTNTQVEGVDEADIVKTDGNYLYVLHDRTLSIVEAFPASSMSMSASVGIEGYPVEMFQTEDKLVVYSHVDGQPIYEAAGIEGRADYYGGYYGAEEGDYVWYPTMTKVTVLDLAGTQITLNHEFYFEGSYSSSRRVGRDVRTVLSGGEHGPQLRYWPEYEGDDYNSYPDSSMDWMLAIERMRADNVSAIEASTLEDYLPHRFVRGQDGIELLAPSCATFYTPTEGTTEYGMTEIAAFNLDDPSTLNETTIVGWADTVYSSEDAMYLATRSYNPYQWGYVLPEFPVSTQATHIHKFDLQSDPSAPQYVASGTVAGHLNNQFSMDEREGVLRLATTDVLASENTWESVNNVFALSQKGFELKEEGSVRGLAEGETIFSARFVGDRGYVVTFRQVDPLFVIDLANPAEPKVVAELKIPGFSEYMHPIEDGKKLLTVGRDGNDEGQVFGVALQIFDVTDPTDPKLTAKHVMSDDSWGGSTEASYNHKAFTYYKDMLAIPFESYDYNTGEARSSLEVFEIGSETGITPIGSIDHSGFFTEQYDSYCYGVGVRRGLFIEDHVYSVSHGGILVNSIDDMNGEPVASVAFESTQEACNYYY